MQCHAIPWNTMRYHAISCNTMHYHAIQWNTMQPHAISCIINNCWWSVPLPCGQDMAIFFILTISYFTGTSELPSPCHLLVNNFICPRYPGTQVPGTRYLVPGSQVSVGQQSFLSQVPPRHKKVHGAGPLGQEGAFPCQSDWSEKCFSSS